jgi:HSP20 family protein
MNDSTISKEALTMWTWSDLNRTFAALDLMRERMDRAFQELGGAAAVGWPPANVLDTGAALVVALEAPGLGEKDVSLTATADSLVVSGERKADLPEGYAVHRAERGALRFSRSFTMPTKIDADKVTATIKNGLLTITLPKAAEAQPRQITVKAG